MGCTCKKPKIQKIEADSMELPQTGYPVSYTHLTLPTT